MKAQALIPLAEVQARRHIDAIGDVLEWLGCPLYFPTLAKIEFLSSPKLADILTPAHEFIRRHRPVSDSPDTPALKVLDEFLTKFFPAPAWDGCLIHELEAVRDVWVATHEVYTSRLLFFDDYRQGLVECGLPEEIAEEATRLRRAGAPYSESDIEVIKQVSRILGGKWA